MAVVASISAQLLLRGAPEIGLSQPRHLGDINGDGLGDFVVVPFGNLRSGGTLNPPSGPVAVVQFGAAVFPAEPGLIDASDAPANGFAFRLDGAQALSQRNFVALPLGDYDLDGTPDLLLAPTATLVVGSGGRAILSTAPDVEILIVGGISPSMTTAPGDVTGDGLPDVAFASVTNTFGAVVSSAITIVAGTGDVEQSETVFGGAEFLRFSGLPAFATPKRLDALGDVNGDGVDDLGVQYTDNSLYVLFGGGHLVEDGVNDIDALVTEGLAAKITADQRQVLPWLADQTPFAVTSVDIDGDGVRDIVIGAGFTGDTISSAGSGLAGDPVNGFSPADGVLMVVRGGEALEGRTISLALDEGGVAADPSTVFAIDYRGAGASALGQALSAGDFDGDGRDDLAFWRGDGLIGVLTGLDAASIDAGGFVDLDTQGVDVIKIDAAALPLGPSAFRAPAFGFPALSFSLDLGGDLNGDGANDLLIGLPAADITGIVGAGLIRDGAVVVAYGTPAIPPDDDPFVPIVNDRIVVNTLADTVDADMTVTSLREAVEAANRAGRPITIELGPGRHVLEGEGLAVIGQMAIEGAGRSGADATVITGAESLLPDALFTVQPGAELFLTSLVLRNESGSTTSETRSNETSIANNNTVFLDGRGVTVNAGLLNAEDVTFQELGSFSKRLNRIEEDEVFFYTKTFEINVFYDFTEGGAIFNRDGMVEIAGSSFINNGAGRGGAIAQQGGQLSVEDTIFLDNRSASDITTTFSDTGNVVKTGRGGGKQIVPDRDINLIGGGKVDGAGALIHNTGGVVELVGTITEAGSTDAKIARISTDTPILPGFALVSDNPGGLIHLRPETAAAARFSSFAAAPESELAHASLAAAAAPAAAPEIAGPLLLLGEGALDLGDGAPAFGAPSVENGVITVVIAGLTVTFSGDGLTLDADAFDFDDALASLASLGGTVTGIVVADADGVEVLRLSGVAIPAADIPATLATIEDGAFPNLLDLFGIAPAVLGGDANDLIAGGGGDNLLLGGDGDDDYVFEGDFGADTVDETASGGLDTLVFPDLAGPQALAVSLTPDAVLLSVIGTASSVTALRDAFGETGIERVRFGTREPIAFADLIADAPVAPEAVDDAAEVAEDGPPVLIDALANDAGEGLTLLSVEAPARGTARIENGVVVFDPAGAFAFLRTGETAREIFAYVAGDGVQTATAAVAVTIRGANDAPEPQDDAGEGFATEAGAAFLTASVLANDADPDAGDSLTLVGFDASGVKGQVSHDGGGVFRYDPDGAFDDLADGETAVDRFTYTIADQTGATASATVEIGVTGVPDAPRTQQIVVHASGENHLGDPRFDLLVNGVLFAEDVVVASPSRPLTRTERDDLAEAFVFDLDAGVAVETVSVVFDNDRWGGTRDQDRNLFVSKVEFGGATYTPQDHGVFTPEGGADARKEQIVEADGAMFWNGELEFAERQRITVFASGENYRGNPKFDLAVNGETIARNIEVASRTGILPFEAREPEADAFQFKLDADLVIETVAVIFRNDRYDGQRDLDRNLFIPKIDIDGVEFRPDTHAEYFKARGESPALQLAAEMHGHLFANGALVFGVDDPLSF